MQEYETIKSARAVLAARPASKTADAKTPDPRTIAGYKLRAIRLIKKANDEPEKSIDGIIANAKRTGSMSSWYSNRAALTFFYRLMLERQLAEQDKAQRALKAARVPETASAWDTWRGIVGNIGMLLDWIGRLQSEPGPALEDRIERHSKRGDLHGLPRDWREKLIARMPKYRLAALVNAVTGCRPEELAKGVQLAIVDGMLVATIQGAKITEKTGQPWRRLSWPVDSNSPLVRALVAEVTAGVSVVQIDNPKTYSSAMRAAGEREWPGRKNKKTGKAKTVTPYCFRHAAASDMKASKMGREEISQALGHCSDVTKQYYGSWSQGRAGGVAPRSVEAARAVRIAKKPAFRK